MADRDDELRALLEDAVSDIEPRPGLDRIQARTRATTMRSRRPWLYAAAGAVAATAATLVGVMVIVNHDDSPAQGPAASSPGRATGSGPSGAPATSPDGAGPASPSGSTGSAGKVVTATVPVYYVADTPTGPRLFREFHRAQVPEGDTKAVAKAALVDAMTDSALDPDYRSPWASLGAAAGLAEVTPGGGAIVVDMGGVPPDRPQGMSAQEAEAAVQQLVYTAQAAFQDRAPVQFMDEGSPVGSVLGVPAADPLPAADPMQAQGTVWVIDPQDGTRVGPTFTVQGRGAFFEANVSWQLLQGDRVVKQGHAMAEECCVLSPYRFTVRNVAPGDYTLRVYDADMSGGEGNGEAEDTKQVTVTQ